MPGQTQNGGHLEMTILSFRHMGLNLEKIKFSLRKSSSGHLHVYIYNLALPFLPKGHFATTAGRHDDGGRTWFGLKRKDLAMYVIVQYCLIYTASTLLFLKTFNMNAREREEQGTAGRQFRSLFLNVRRLLDLSQFALFTYVGYRLLRSVPGGWILV